MKFGKTYNLQIEVAASASAGPRKITIDSNSGIGIYFDIVRNTLASANTAKIIIHELGPALRNVIFRDRSELSTTPRGIELRAGYGSFTPLVFKGEITQAGSYREREKWITEIDCFDTAFAMINGFSSIAIGAAPGGESDASNAINLLNDDLPQVTAVPIIGSFPTKALRGEVLFGNTWRLLLKKSNGNVSIDNGQLKALNTDECIIGQIPVLDGSTGLLGSPKITGKIIEIETLFEPRLTVGQIIQLNSFSNPIINRQYKVIGFEHHATIGPTVDGESKTLITLFLGLSVLTVLKNAAASVS